MTRPLRTALLTLGLCLAAAPAVAQQLSGRVLDHASGEPLAGVEIVLLDTEGRQHDIVATDSLGEFTLDAPRSGHWIVTAELFGYGPAESAPVDVAPGQRVQLEIRLSVQPIPVAPVVVTGRAENASPQIQAFYDRVRRGRRSGLGRFVTRADIDRGTPLRSSDMLRTMAGIRITPRQGRFGTSNRIRMSRGCDPAIYVDGTQINRYGGGDALDDVVVPSNIEGIEVYRGAGQVEGYYDDGGCGLILVWTRRGTTEGKAFSWIRLLVGASLMLGILLLQ